MKYTVRPKNVFSLTSDQLEEALANAFLRFVSSTAEPHIQNPKIAKSLFLNDGNPVGTQPFAKSEEKKTKCNIKNSGKKIKLKGHVPIRSQTGHDHDRNHKKY